VVAEVPLDGVIKYNDQLALGSEDRDQQAQQNLRTGYR
jgi:hypothetical protein